MLWSSGFVGAELGTRYTSADTLLAWRYIVAAATLGALAALLGTRLRARALLRHGTLGLLCQCLYLGGVVTGVGLGVPAGTTALIAAAPPRPAPCSASTPGCAAASGSCSAWSGSAWS